MRESLWSDFHAPAVFEKQKRGKIDELLPGVAAAAKTPVESMTLEQLRAYIKSAAGK